MQISLRAGWYRLKVSYFHVALALHLVHALSTIGFSIMASADTSAKYVHQENGPDYPLDVHSWFLIRTEALEKSNLKYGVHPEPVAFVDQLGVPPPYSYPVPLVRNFILVFTRE